MVAYRSRVLALWFTAMMLASVVTITAAPPASAAHTAAQAADTTLLLQRGTAGYVPYAQATHGPILVGDKISVWWNATWTDASCDPQALAGNPASSRWDLAATTDASVDATAIGGAANAGVVATNVSAQTGGAIKWRFVFGNQTVTEATANLTNAEGTNKTLSVKFTLTCGKDVATRIATAPTDTGNYVPSPAFALDAKLPTLDVGSVNIVHDPSVRANAGTGATAAIGSRIFFNVTTDGSKIFWDTSAWLSGGGEVEVGSQRDLLVQEASSTWRSLQGNLVIPLRTEDANGQSRTGSVTIPIDNVRPTAAEFPGFGAARSTIVRQLYRDAVPATGTSYLYPNFTSTVPFVRATITDTATGATATVVQGVGTLATPRAWSFADPARNYAAPLSVAITAVDAAGNVASESTLTATMTFPVMDVAYGPGGGSPFAASGTQLGRVFINVTSGGPSSYAYPAPVDGVAAPGPLWGELLRERENLMTYWTVGTKGDAEAHFTTTQQLDMHNEAAGGSDDTVTAFRANPAPSSGLGISMGNLTGTDRAFMAGSYELRVHLEGAAHDVIAIFPFKVDPAAPRPFAKSATDGGFEYPQSISLVPANTNMTGTNVVHGMDGNPFQAFYRVGEDQRDANGALKDSGLRNVTFELFDPATSEVPKRSTTGLPASINIAPGNGVCSPDPATVDATLRYCYDFTGWWKNDRFNASSASGGCGGLATPATPANGPSDKRAICEAWHDAIYNLSSRVTWVNELYFSGWVNLTFPDLPAGRYRARLVAYDIANNVHSAVGPSGSGATSFYHVLPAVAISAEPRMSTANILDVVPAASQRYATPPANVSTLCVNADGSTNAPRDVCPPYAVRLYVTNSPTNGSEHSLTGEDRTYITVDAATYAQNDGGFAGARLANGSLVYDSNVPIRFFKYIDTNPPNLTSVVGLNLSQDIYVRAEAVAFDGALNEITRKTDWVKVASPTQPALSVVFPSRDWQVNKTGELPPLNITFDRKTSTDAPSVRYWVNSTTVGDDGIPTFTVLNDSRLAPVKKFGTVSHWVTKLTKTLGTASIPSTTPLDPGAYTVDVMVFVAGATPAEDQILARTTRFFAVQAQPTVTFLPPQAGSGFEWGPPHFAGRAFDIPFRVDHGEANLTSLSKLSFKLTTGTTEILPGPTFSVTPRADSVLTESSTSTEFTASVTLPANSVDNDPYQLVVTVDLAETGDSITDPSGFLTFRYDGVGPTITFDAIASERKVFNATSSPKKDLANPSPAFLGTVRDRGAGIQSMEVRIFDQTTGRTLRLVNATANDPSGYATVVGLSNDWANNTLFYAAPDAGARFVQLGTPASDGTTPWTLPLKDRTTTLAGTNLPDLWRADGNGIINLTHKYRLDFRATDRLGQVTTSFVEDFDFDAAGPTLGLNALGTTSGMKSGIVATSTVVNWHTEGGRSSVLRVNVTDNQCITGVFLLAKSDKHPSRTFQAPMFPEGVTDAQGTRVCYSQMPTQANGEKYVTYALDLANAPVNLTDDVTNYTYWWKAVDEAGQESEVPADQRTFRMRVEDSSPAVIVSSIEIDPSPGQSGGRALVRVNAFDNAGVANVSVAFHRGTGPTSPVVARANMTRENTTADGVGWWKADTQDDLNLTLETGDYFVSITPYDINWNRSVSPTCLGICSSFTRLYQVRDDGLPSTQIVSPANGSTVNSTPTFVFRALHRSLDTSRITVRASLEGNVSNMTTVPASQVNFTELKASNGSRQGWTVTYTPGTLADNTTILVNVTASLGGLLAAGDYTFRVDALPPELSLDVTGTRANLSDRVWGVATTRVTLTAQDTVSATTILYTVNNGTETTYNGPITPSGDDGAWFLEAWARDAAGNVAPTQTLLLHLDRAGPRIAVSGHGDNVTLTVSDAGVGVNDSTVTVHYRYGGATEFTPITAQRIAGGNSYRASLPGDAAATGLSYYFTALDLLGNQGTNFSAASPHTIPRETGGGPGPGPTPNEPPTLTIDAPADGASVSGVVQIRWTARDPEGVPLTVIVTRNNPDTVLVNGGADTGRHDLNVSALTPGAYTITVTVSDGASSTEEQVTFNVVAPQTITVPRPPPRTAVPAGTPVPIEVSITPSATTVSRATYSLVKNGTVVTTGPLVRNAAGNYAAILNATEAGTYAVVVDVVYANQTSEQKAIGQFAVAGTATPPVVETARGALPVSLMVLAALAVLTVALAAYGAFGRWRK